jgi:hypothetical protein
VRIELTRQKSQNSTSSGRSRWMMLTWAPAATFTHGRLRGNSGAAMWSTGARNRGAQPIEPTISSWMRRLSSTAYSIGSSFVTGSMKPLTIIAAASSSVKPREPM